MTASNQRRPLIVTGYHRSGTSLVSQKLAKAGVHMGARMLGAHESNPDGHYEDMDFLEFHEKILRQSGVDWIVDEPFLRRIDDEDYLHAMDLIATRRAFRDGWGFKDPRVCLFLWFWKRITPDAVFLVVLRDVEEVVRSIVTRSFAATRADPKKRVAANARIIENPEVVYCSWLYSMLEVRDFIRSNPESCVVGSYEDCLKDAWLIPRLEAKGVKLSRTDDQVIIREERLQKRRSTFSNNAALLDKVGVLQLELRSIVDNAAKFVRS